MMSSPPDSSGHSGVPAASELQDLLATQIHHLNVAGASIALGHRGDRVAAAAGFADCESNTPASIDTLFEIGSITKVFTATLMVRLAAENRVPLDAPVIDLLPHLRIDGRSVPETLTVRTLLDYTAGMEGEYFEDFGEDPDALARYCDACRRLRWIHPPGTMRAYNSTAYCIAGRVIEVATGQGFERACDEWLLRPLGIADHSFDDAAPGNLTLAQGHHWNDAAQAHARRSRPRLPRAMAASGSRLAMSASSLLRFGEFHNRDGTSEAGSQLIPASDIRAMREPAGFLPPNNAERLLGWAATEFGEHRVILASGATVEQNSFLLLVPQQDFALSILTNGAGAAMLLLETIGLELLASCTGIHGTLPTPDLTPGESSLAPGQIVGTYTNGSIYTIREVGGQLFLDMAEMDTNYSSGARASMRMVSLGENRYGIHPEGAAGPVAALEMLFHTETGRPTSQATHISQGGRLFARLD